MAKCWDKIYSLNVIYLCGVGGVDQYGKDIYKKSPKTQLRNGYRLYFFK